MTKDNLLWFQSWFYEQCDGDWEHRNGIQLDSIDNPGWYLTIDLKGTEFENKTFRTIDKETSEIDWLFCFVKDNKFEGRSGPLNLNDILELFRNWIENKID